MNPGDLRFFGLFVAAVLVAAGLGLVALRLAGKNPARVLTRREWALLLKLVAIFFFALILMQTAISRELPAEMFIYGRF